MSERKSSFYVTTPIYYVNDKPHIGHAYTTILADVLASYHRLLDVPTHFLTGTDEHGQKVQQAAEDNGIKPIEQCDQTVVRFEELWNRLEITNDDFIRTTQKRHTDVVQATLQSLYDRGEIYKGEYQGWYCVSSERFLTEKELTDENCPDYGKPVESIVESNYFFKMSKYQDWLIEYIESNPDFIQPAFRANETLGFLKSKPLQDLCISRPKSRLEWGIELPFDDNFVTYVWFDALINYISAVGYLSDQKQFNSLWPCSCHLIGKDILTTHTVYWPTMLKAMGLDMPESIFAHGWWLTGRTKMSKSLGNVVNPMDMIDQYGVDAFRYFLISEMKLGQDASFTEEIFIKRYNSDLANDLGNVSNRILNMLSRYCDSKIPSKPSDEVLKNDNSTKELLINVENAVTQSGKFIKGMKLDSAATSIMKAVRSINVYLQEKAPWSAVKEGRQEDVEHSLYIAADSLQRCAALLYPIMPQKMINLRHTFGFNRIQPELENIKYFGGLSSGISIKQPDVLFPRIELKDKKSVIVKETKREKNMKQNFTEEGVVTFDQVMALKMKIAKILVAEIIEGADKLLKLQIDLGDKKKQIVAGIAMHYQPEELIGKTIVVIDNLKPAKLRGEISEGMLLAASSSDKLKLVTIDGELPPGCEVK